MRSLVVFFFLLPFAAGAAPQFDSLFSKSHVIVIGRMLYPASPEEAHE